MSEQVQAEVVQETKAIDIQVMSKRADALNTKFGKLAVQKENLKQQLEEIEADQLAISHRLDELSPYLESTKPAQDATEA